MWLVPLRLGGEGTTTPRCALPPGRYLLPWYHTETESLRLAWLLSHLVEEVSFFVEVPWEALPLPGNHGLRQPERAVVVVRVPPDVTPEQAEPQLARLQGRYQLVQFAEPVDQVHGDEGYGWQERFLQEHVVTLIRRNLADPDHPLRDLGVAHLPVRLATRLTTDVAELLRLEATMTHRLGYSTLGTRSSDYEHSLWHVAGRHLAWRIMRVEPRLLTACVNLLLFDQPAQGGRAPQARGRTGESRTWAVRWRRLHARPCPASSRTRPPATCAWRRCGATRRSPAARTPPPPAHPGHAPPRRRSHARRVAPARRHPAPLGGPPLA
ncbi:MAG: hypothetical protein R3F43_05380 [bacterium]